MTRTFTLMLAVLVAAFALFACGEDSSTPDTPVTDIGGDTNPDVTDSGDTTEQPLEASLEVQLSNVVADGNLEFAVFEDGSMDVAWMPVMEETYSTVIPVYVGDIYVIRLRYDDDFEYELAVSIDEEYVLTEVDVDVALPCARYADVADYVWTCEGTIIANHDGFYVTMEGGQCLLWAEGFMTPGILNVHWVYHGEGEMSTYLCDQPWCLSECTGTPIND